MRVLFINPGLGLGGAEQSLLLLLEGLQQRDVEPVVALFGEGPFAHRLREQGIAARFIEIPAAVRRYSRYRPGLTPTRSPALTPLRAGSLAAASIATVRSLAVLARAEHVAVVHTNGLKAHYLGALAGRAAGARVLWHVRDFPPSGSFFGLTARLASLVIANSNAVAQAVRSTTRVPVHAFYNPVDLARFHPSAGRGQLRAELGLEADIPLVGLVAHLAPWKGHELFIRIAAEVPEAHFVVVGGSIYETAGNDDGYATWLRELTAELGLQDRVTFTGTREDVGSLMADLDVLVHCPVAPEPFGRAVAEAMACGKPVVAANCGGLPELVDNRRTGILVPPGDHRAFATAVADLVRDHVWARALGEAGRARAERMFDPGRHASAVARTYKELLEVRSH